MYKAKHIYVCVCGFRKRSGDTYVSCLMEGSIESTFRVNIYESCCFPVARDTDVLVACGGID